MYNINIGKMKKRLFLLTLCLICVFSFNVNAQQGKWAGTVKYQLTWTGGSAGAGLPTESEVKIFENKTKYVDMRLGATVLTDAEKKTVTMMFDFSQIPVEDVAGKWFVKDKLEDSVISKFQYNFTGNTKQIANKNAKEVVVSYDNNGVQESETIWVSDEFGPLMDISNYPGLKALPLEYKMEFGEDVSCTFIAVEFIEGKVKRTDVLLESDYDELTMEEFQEKMNVLMEAIGGGSSDDDI